MIKTSDLIEILDVEYHDMVKEVNIPDFYKCIAEYSGLKINDISDDVIKRYLITWAKNKLRFYKLFCNNIRFDIDFSFDESVATSIKDKYVELGVKFPTYNHWLMEMVGHRENKLERTELSWRTRELIDKAFPDFKYDTTITRFLKRRLNAPDELVTAVAAIYEKTEVNGKYTLSIDPVDMMLASENPYDWKSCYRLEPCSSSHADGCLAAVLDTKTIISYVWTEEGKMKIYDEYEFKNVRYKRMRQWIAMSDDFTVIHFNEVYPKKDGYPDELLKELRDKVETIVAVHNGKENKWKKAGASVRRKYDYGYCEYCSMYTWGLSEVENFAGFEVFDVEIECPCGCGTILTPSGLFEDEDYDDDYVEYNGCGFNCRNIEHQTRHWCEEADCYCHCEYESDECRCADCCYYRAAHPICSLTQEECPTPDFNEVNSYDEINPRGYIENCRNCPHWQECKREGENEE